MLLTRTLLKRHSVLPGFDLALGFALLYLSLIVLIPLSAAFLKTFTMTWAAFWDAVSSPRVVASYRLTFGASFAAALLIAGSLISVGVAWGCTLWAGVGTHAEPLGRGVRIGLVRWRGGGCGRLLKNGFAG